MLLLSVHKLYFASLCVVGKLLLSIKYFSFIDNSMLQSFFHLWHKALLPTTGCSFACGLLPFVMVLLSVKVTVNLPWARFLHVEENCIMCSVTRFYPGNMFPLLRYLFQDNIIYYVPSVT